MNILRNIYRNFYLSPTYCAGAAFGLGTIIEDIRKNEIPGKFSGLGLLILIAGSQVIRSNFYNYRRVLHTMQAHGYSEKVCNLYLKTFCGRQAVKLAAKESGFTTQQQLHFFKKNVRWYHFEEHPLWNLLIPVGETVKCIAIPYFIWNSGKSSKIPS